jgi:hypothetical protein
LELDRVPTQFVSLRPPASAEDPVAIKVATNAVTDRMAATPFGAGDCDAEGAPAQRRLVNTTLSPRARPDWVQSVGTLIMQTLARPARETDLRLPESVRAASIEGEQGECQPI